jgi:glycosyltransferase involved in cell wall biosynthesis
MRALVACQHETVKVLVLNWKDLGAPDAGGAELYVGRVIERLIRAGHQVTVFSPKAVRGQSSPADHANHIRRGNRLTVFWWALRHLRSNAASYDRVIESVSTRPFRAHDVVGPRAIALYHQVADEVWLHEYPLPIALIGRHLVEPRWLRGMRFGRVVAVSRSTAESLQRYGIRPEAIIPPGCDLPRPPSRFGPAENPSIVFIGRLVRTKRVEDAIQAFSRIRSAIPMAHLHVIGTGYLQAKLESAASPGVTIHGYLSEGAKNAVLANADVLLFPATREGWGIVVIEAAAHGVPTVAYDVPGVRDAVEAGVSGELTRCDPAALADAAIRLLRDGDRWRALSLGARRRAEAHTWEATTDAILHLLEAPSPPASTSTFSLGHKTTRSRQ